ncbi:MAG: urease accessory protein UreD [Gammaproteobacteria bacterium]|nr:urease accessory protein UreD [Gammaproteobacteria bacterium]
MKQQGWQAELALKFSPRPDKTVLSGRKQRGPLTVQRPFYPEDGVCHLYVLHPPGSVVGGDALQIDATVESGANALVTTPGATKFYRSAGLEATQIQRLTIDRQASLEWLPQENIFFSGSRVSLRNEIHLHDKAGFIGWEIHCLGRPASDERFSDGSADFSLKLFRENKPLLLERLSLKDQSGLLALSGLRQHPVVATLLATRANPDILETVQQRFSQAENAQTGYTLLEDLLVCRYLGHSTEQARQLLTSIWSCIRPLTLGRAACPPRIWST